METSTRRGLLGGAISRVRSAFTRGADQSVREESTSKLSRRDILSRVRDLTKAGILWRLGAVLGVGAAVAELHDRMDYSPEVHIQEYNLLKDLSLAFEQPQANVDMDLIEKMLQTSGLEQNQFRIRTDGPFRLISKNESCFFEERNVPNEEKRTVSIFYREPFGDEDGDFYVHMRLEYDKDNNFIGASKRKTHMKSGGNYEEAGHYKWVLKPKNDGGDTFEILKSFVYRSGEEPAFDEHEPVLNFQDNRDRKISIDIGPNRAFAIDQFRYF